MPVQITQFPQRDSGTGEHSQATEPQTVTADDVDNVPVDAEELPATQTFTADDVDNQPAADAAGGFTERDPEPQLIDWPPQAENKAVTQAENKADTSPEPVTEPKPAKKAARKRAAAKKRS